MQPKLKVEKAKTADLIPYVGNAKIHSAEQIEQIAASIEQFGFSDPVGVWTNKDGQLEIVEGHGRVLAASLLDMDSVPIIRLDHLDDDARRAYVHVHNQTTLSSGFDVDSLVFDLNSIEGFDWEEFGFDLPKFSDDIPDDNEINIDEKQVIVIDVEESEIEEVFDSLTSEGYRCRILTL